LVTFLAQARLEAEFVAAMIRWPAWSLDFDSLALSVMPESRRRIEIFVKPSATPPDLALEQPPL
jgi:hypothetical protein